MEDEQIIPRLPKELAERAKKGEIIKTLTYPDGADNVDKAIIDIINSSNRSMSINTLKNKYLKTTLNFEERIQKLAKVCKGLRTWEKKKETLQIGTEKEYVDSIEEEDEE